MAYFVRKRFDSNVIDWKDDYEWNRMMVTHVLLQCKRRLERKGYLFLNDVYGSLGLPLTKNGQITGWTYEDLHTDFEWTLYKIKNKSDIGIKLYSPKDILDVLPEE